MTVITEIYNIKVMELMSRLMVHRININKSLHSAWLESKRNSVCTRGKMHVVHVSTSLPDENLKEVR